MELPAPNRPSAVAFSKGRPPVSKANLLTKSRRPSRWGPPVHVPDAYPAETVPSGEQDPPTLDYFSYDPEPYPWTTEQMNESHHQLMRLYQWSNFYMEAAINLGRQIHAQVTRQHEDRLLQDARDPTDIGYRPIGRSASGAA